ncbi:MAG: hypothetical protein A2X05_07570 [Bacteroidetes bacterium GWE2_41_25]|nr:MAG: hypothetical protein A2X03_05650 [Bacteroidetes bacterium GWA2_40_15]OFX89700.1 MAG: hypothetical protein A2X06_09620 [Bacteroidetes bacterium GWC2_40_22]OFY00673.1 MAG: hypothetical protein A2X05_07570 [Bacteroidetes bacterium GWE2_41_25]OFY61305.1 MAG: hypothetical protein A2X04_09140 [Bacteroidetes bacterium GWF2_41_9]HAM11434.1 hypothetical protein [Bacteroidales bacterium]
MADSRANIDLVFRNGLKDFEVLPPSEIWDNIHPVIKRRKSPLPLLRAAAAVAVIVSLGFLAYRWSMEASLDLIPESVAENQQLPSSVAATVTSVISGEKNRNVRVVSTRPVNTEPEISPVSLPEKEIIPVSEKVSYSVPSYLLTDYQSVKGLQNTSDRKNTKVVYPEIKPVTYEYFQENIEMPAMDRWSVTAMASPTYYSQFTSSGNDLAKKLMESDQTRVSYTGGVSLAYRINSRFSIQSGLYYSTLGQEMNGITAYSGFQKYDNSKGGPNFKVLTANGTVQTNNSDIFLSSYSLPERILTYFTNDIFDPVKASLSYVSSTLFQDMSFLELPVVVRYKVIDRKVDLNLIGGMSYNFLLGNVVYAEKDGGRYPVGTTEGLNDVSLSSSLGMGMEYNLSQNLSLNLEPTFRYYINPFNSARSTGLHPYSLGVFSGLAYKF